MKKIMSMISMFLISLMASVVFAQTTQIIEYPAYLQVNEPILVIVGDTAPAYDVIAAVDISKYLNTRGLKTTAKLASEISDITAQNSIIVGNVCNNPLTHKFLGRQEPCDKENKQGTGFVRIIIHPTEKVTIIVSGYGETSTRKAANILTMPQKLEQNDPINIKVEEVQPIVPSIHFTGSIFEINEGETKVFKIYSKNTNEDEDRQEEYEIEALTISVATKTAKFNVNGEKTKEIEVGQEYTLANGKILTIREIASYQSTKLPAQALFTITPKQMDVEKITKEKVAKKQSSPSDMISISNQPRIADIAGNKYDYEQNEKIEWTIKAMEPDGTPASYEEGYNVQFYTYDLSTRQRNEEIVKKGQYNAEYHDGHWYVKFYAPETVSSYKTEVSLYCKKENTKCWNNYGHGNEWKRKEQFTVVLKGTSTKEQMVVYTDKKQYARNEPIKVFTKLPNYMDCEHYFVSSSGEKTLKGAGGCAPYGQSYGINQLPIGEWKTELIVWYPESPDKTHTLISPTFIVSESYSTEPLPTPISVPLEKPQIKPKECIGCEINNKCLQFGVRLLTENNVPVYCDWDQALKPQKQNAVKCQNNYECISNSCGNGMCNDIEERIKGIEQELKEQKGIMQRILNFFAKLFSMN